MGFDSCAQPGRMDEPGLMTICDEDFRLDAYRENYRKSHHASSRDGGYRIFFQEMTLQPCWSR
jgi:hypothetical protein